MAVTRKTTGNSKPRVLEAISTEPSRKRTTTKKTTKPKSNTSAKRVTKPTSKTTTTKRKPGIKNKVEGAVEKTVGKVERKPGKEASGTKKIKGETGHGGAKTKKAVAI